MKNNDTYSFEGFIAKAKNSRYLCIALLITLICCYGLHYFSAANNAFFKVAVVVLPLALFLPGLTRGNYRTGSWLCFVLLVYFISGIQNIFTPGQEYYDAIVITVIVLLFVTSMMYSRWQQRANIEQGVK